MPKHLSQQRQRHIERQQNREWWKDLKKVDVRTLTPDEINGIKDRKVRSMVKLWRKLAKLGQ